MHIRCHYCFNHWKNRIGPWEGHQAHGSVHGALTETILPLRSNQHRQFLHFDHLMLIESFALKSAWLIDQLIVNLIARNAVTLAVNMIFHNTQPFVQVSKISLSCLPTKV